MGVRLDADGDPDQHLGPDAALLGQVGQPGDLLEGVDDDAADTGVQGLGQLGDGLVVAVHDDPLGREAGGQGDGQLTASAHVE